MAGKFGPVDPGSVMTRVIIAPDKFKGSLPAAEVASALAAGMADVVPGLDVVRLPVADGGEGTLDAAVTAGFGVAEVTAEGPTGEPVLSALAVRGDEAVVELARVAGLRQLPGGRRDPLGSSSFGVGQLLAAALDRGATMLVLGMGGSACTDGGAGMLQALGVRLTDYAGRPVLRGGAALAGLAAVDASGLDPRLRRSRLLVASDVDSPLLGAAGAARMFGPQKGASPAQVRLLEGALAHWADLTRTVTGTDVAAVPGAGSAGGAGFAALAYLGATIRPGIELVLELVGMDAALAGARLVVTGEGRLDRQTLRGKAPAGVAAAAARHGVPVVAVAGRITLSPAELAAAGFAAGYPLSALEPDRSASVRDAAALLTRIGGQIAADLPRLCRR